MVGTVGWGVQAQINDKNNLKNYVEKLHRNNDKIECGYMSCGHFIHRNGIICAVVVFYSSNMSVAFTDLKVCGLLDWVTIVM